MTNKLYSIYLVKKEDTEIAKKEVSRVEDAIEQLKLDGTDTSHLEKIKQEKQAAFEWFKQDALDTYNEYKKEENAK